jgi:hypothetical protein
MLQSYCPFVSHGSFVFLDALVFSLGLPGYLPVYLVYCIAFRSSLCSHGQGLLDVIPVQCVMLLGILVTVLLHSYLEPGHGCSSLVRGSVVLGAGKECF